MSGAMGGSASEEFLALSETGEDTFVRSPGGYAANVEAVRTPTPDDLPFDDVPAAHVEDTPDTPTIASLVAVANERYPRDDRPWTGADTLKNVVLMVTEPGGKQAPLVLGLPGDREVDLKRVQAQLEPAEVEIFDAFDAYPFPSPPHHSFPHSLFSPYPTPLPHPLTLSYLTSCFYSTTAVGRRSARAARSSPRT